MSELPADWTPPPRSLLYVRPMPPGDGGGLEIGCDCGTIEDIEHLDEPREAAFTCEGCQSVHWFTAGPGVRDG